MLSNSAMFKSDKIFTVLMGRKDASSACALAVVEVGPSILAQSWKNRKKNGRCSDTGQSYARSFIRKKSFTQFEHHASNSSQGIESPPAVNCRATKA